MERWMNIGAKLEDMASRVFARFTGVETFSSEKDIINHQVMFINEAKGEIDIFCPANELSEPRVINALKRAIERGVNIKVIFTGKVDEESSKEILKIEKLMRYRPPSTLPPRNHFLVVDKSEVMLEKLHFPDDQRECYFKEESIFLGKRLYKEFIELALVSKTF